MTGLAPSGKSGGPCRTIGTMRADVRTIEGERLGRVEIDETARPVRVQPPLSERPLFLEWDGALDDAGHLRSCVICGHPRLYRSRSLPQLTPFVVLLAFAGAAVGLLGFATNPLILTLLALLLIVDVGLLVFARTRIVCYRCGTVYDRLPIARYHHPWDASIAERETPVSRSGGGAASTDDGDAPETEEDES